MGSEVTQVACGRAHTLVFIESTGKLYTFGHNNRGQLGNSKLLETNNPIKLKVNLADLNNSMETDGDEDTWSLYSIHAGGDQSFIVLKPLKLRIPSIDHRTLKIAIKTIEVVRELSESPLTQQITTGSTSFTSQALIHTAHFKDMHTLFSSSACLNASFLDTRNYQHFLTSNKIPGVDFEKAKEMNTFLLGLGDEFLNELVITDLAKLFQSLTDNPPSVECLRIYLTTPFLVDFERISQNNVHSLLFAYAQAVNRLKKTPGRVLDHWFAWAKTELFRKLLRSYKSIVVYVVNLPKFSATDNYINNLLKTSMIFLKKLHKINDEFKDLVSYDEFYIPEIVEKVNIKQDYEQWSRRRAPKTDRILFCEFPFVFDARAKSLLLEADADIQMQTALEEAFYQNIGSMFSSRVQPVNPYLILIVRRDHIVTDTISQLGEQLREDLKKPLKVNTSTIPYYLILLN